MQRLETRSDADHGTITRASFELAARLEDCATQIRLLQREMTARINAKTVAETVKALRIGALGARRDAAVEALSVTGHRQGTARTSCLTPPQVGITPCGRDISTRSIRPGMRRG